MDKAQKEKSNFFDFQISGKKLYFLAFVIYFLPTFLLDTMFSAYLGAHELRLIAYLCLPFLFVKTIFVDKWSKKQLFVIALLFLISLVVWRKSQNIQLVFLLPFIVGAKDVNLEDILSWFFKLSFYCMLLTMVFSLIRIIPNLIYVSESRPTRYSLGMAYATYSATHYLYMVLSYCYLRFGRLSILDYIGIAAFDVVFMLLTNTRLDFIAVLLVIPFIEVAQRSFYGKRWAEILASFFWMATPVIATITLIAAYFYTPGNHILRRIDHLTSGRLFLSHLAFQKNNVNLLGRRIVEHAYSGFKGHAFQNNAARFPGMSYFFVDSSYVRMLLLWGFIVFTLVIISMTIIALHSTVNKTFALSAIMVIVALNCMFEPYIIYLVYNPFLLALFATKNINRLSGGQNE